MVWMQHSSYKPGRIFLCRVKHGSELIKSILEFAKEKKLKMAFFNVIGAVKDATIAYYDQPKREYQKIRFDRHLEVANCFGNLSFKDGKLFAHAHVVLSDQAGKAYGGHLLRATVFAAEVHLQELLGEKLDREYDQTTGLALWSYKK